MKKGLVLGLILSLGLMVSCTTANTKEADIATEKAVRELTEVLREIHEEAIKENKRKVLKALKNLQAESMDNESIEDVLSIDNEQIRTKEE